MATNHSIGDYWNCNNGIALWENCFLIRSCNKILKYTHYSNPDSFGRRTRGWWGPWHWAKVIFHSCSSSIMLKRPIMSDVDWFHITSILRSVWLNYQEYFSFIELAPISTSLMLWILRYLINSWIHYIFSIGWHNYHVSWITSFP